jgi:hypothetical protein
MFTIDPVEVYNESIRNAEKLRAQFRDDEGADELIRWAMMAAMRAGLFFAYADLQPLQKEIIRIQHGPDVQDGHWRFEDGLAIPVSEAGSPAARP